MTTTRHSLYVLAGGGRRAAARALLLYVRARLPALRRALGVELRARRVRWGGPAAAARLRGALEKRGIRSLPALVTPSGVVQGGRAIRAYYEEALRAPAPAPAGGEDDLADYYRREMGAPSEEEEAGIGGGRPMMDAYREVMTRRAGGTGGRRTQPELGGGGNAGRPDNVGPPGGGEAGFQDFVARVGEGSASKGNSADDLMERAYWANQEETVLAP